MNTSMQLDMFEGLKTHETDTLLKISSLKKEQDNLRKGVFKRYTEQNTKIKTLTTLMEQLIEVLEINKFEN